MESGYYRLSSLRPNLPNLVKSEFRETLQSGNTKKLLFQELRFIKPKGRYRREKKKTCGFF